MKFLLVLAVFLSQLSITAQINHWESVIKQGDTFKYLIPTSQQDVAWTQSSFDDSSWETGASGFGYGDGDDQTILPDGTTSIFIRRTFDILNLSEIKDVILSIDFDDGYVAYLNGQEVHRINMSGNPPAFDQLTDGQHEALLYQGQTPESIRISKNLLQQGTNILAIEGHNATLGSSDLTLNPFLILGLSTSVQVYQPTPNWFVEPFDFTSSNLPIVIIETNGGNIVNDPKIPATFGVIHNGEGVRNNISDAYEYFGHCGIELRGESSLGFEKHSYGIEMWDELGLDIDTSFLNFPSEEDFILYGPYSDKTQLNNVLAMHLGNRMGHYASRTRHVELVINGDYKGLYVIMEKIKRDDNRVDIAKLNPDELNGDDLTGGYIFRIDKGSYNGWPSQYGAYNNPTNNIYFQFFYPDPETIPSVQGEYIKAFMDEFERSMSSGGVEKEGQLRYTEYINLRSFVDTFILNELSKNVDAYRLSSYFHKQKDSDGGKLVSGPLWDFNLSFGNGDYCGGDNVQGWEYYQCSGSSPFWWDTMLQDTLFANALRCRWESLRAGILSTPSMNKTIDSLTNIINEAQERNFQRWPNLGQYVWPNPPYFYSGITAHSQIINTMKNWIKNRSEWLDNNIPGIAQYCDIYEDLENNVVLGTEIGRKEIIVQPNPTTGNFEIDSRAEVLSVVAFDIHGKQIDVTKSGNEYRLNQKSTGLHFLLIRTKAGPSIQKLLILDE